MKKGLASVCTDEEGARAWWKVEVDMGERGRGVGGVGIGEGGDGNDIIHLGRGRVISHTQRLPRCLFLSLPLIIPVVPYLSHAARPPPHRQTRL